MTFKLHEVVISLPDRQFDWINNMCEQLQFPIDEVIRRIFDDYASFLQQGEEAQRIEVEDAVNKFMKETIEQQSQDSPIAPGYDYEPPKSIDDLENKKDFSKGNMG